MPCSGGHISELSDNAKAVRHVIDGDDVVLGFLYRNPWADTDDSDDYYWQFYCVTDKPLPCGVLKLVSEQLSWLNKELR